MKKFILTGVLLIAAKFSMGQNGSIQGNVKYKNDNSPAGYVQVAITGTPHKVVCDEHGRFALNNVAPGTYTLELTYFEHDTVQETIVIKPEERLTPVLFMEQPQWIRQLKQQQVEQARQDSLNFANRKRRPKKDRPKY